MSAAPLRLLHLSVLGRADPDYEIEVSKPSSVLRLPQLARLEALELSGPFKFWGMKHLLQAVPTAITSLKLSKLLFWSSDTGPAAPEGADLDVYDLHNRPVGTRAWSRLVRLQRLSIAECDARTPGHDVEFRFPEHVSMLTSLRDLDLEIHGRDRGASDEVLARLPASLTALDLRVHWALDSAPLITLADAVHVSGAAELKRARLSRTCGFHSWDLSGLRLGALTSLEMETSQSQPQQWPASLRAWTGLRELRLRTGGGFERTSLPLQQAGDGLAHSLAAIASAAATATPAAAGALPPGALAGLVLLELLEVRRGSRYGGQWSASLLIAGREALRPFTAPGSMARFPAVGKLPAQ